MRLPGQVPSYPLAVLAFDEHKAALQCPGYPHPADHSGEGGFQAVAQPVWLHEQHVVGPSQVSVSGLANGLG